MNTIKKISTGVLQVTVLFFISIAMNKISQLLHLPIPGSILGIIVIFTLLKTNLIKLAWIEQGANWLLAELLLFFIPSAVGVMKYIPMLESDGVRILIVVVSSTLIVMISSGLIAVRIAKRKERWI
ncbi:holin-like protein [Paenibacillus anaericanus]|uniref:CidA/LrgA family holin-like protein n=1 Tax=Paenibacillus anaericanus TaxID=170367 RepID=A0A3S1C5Y1_9BACL|nr:CidA/LrgA family holin-like protein [Paenibacillus anaericanus]MDQ0089763.1 holin-like protein [Paenibacillus anaericanus]RUT43800.1 CidA/LrgA family holin-like protein [Paenibacillus anaericanus]